MSNITHAELLGELTFHRGFPAGDCHGEATLCEELSDTDFQHDTNEKLAEVAKTIQIYECRLCGFRIVLDSTDMRIRNVYNRRPSG